MDKKIITSNKKAFHDFTVSERYVCGMVLTGCEIKSLRRGAVNLKDSFCRVEEGEMFLYKAHIGKYEEGNRYNHEPERTRKLLLTKKELLKIAGKVKQDGYTIIPLEIFIAKGFAKVGIGLCKGKKLHDKRDALKKKAQNRDIERAIKNY